jgi:hypothetical protein
LAFVPIENLAEKDYLPVDAIGFPGDETALTALFCASNFLLIAKESKKLYAMDLALDNPVKKPFIYKIAQTEFEIVQIVFWNGVVVAVGADGQVQGFSLPNLQVKEAFMPELKEMRISCVSVFGDAIGFGCAASNEIIISHQSKVFTLQIPAEAEGTGLKSLFFSSASTLLCSLAAGDPNDYVDLIAIENPLEESPRFAKFLDPCASRPPASNQFYFCGLNDWSSKDLKELVLLGNFGSPDIGVAARLSEGDSFGTFFIDVDEGLAQLPLLKGSELTFPVGLALDFTSNFQHENRQDPDAEPFGPAPVLWILTSAGQLCPFALLKTNEPGPWPFMIEAPRLQLSPSRPLEADVGSDADDSPSPSPALYKSKTAAVTAPSDLSSPHLSSEEEDECSDEQVPVTPSKMSLSALASLQKSAEKLPDTNMTVLELPKLAFDSVKPAMSPLKTEPMTNPFQTGPVKPVESANLFFFKSKQDLSSPSLSTSSLTAASPMSIVSQEPTIPAPIKKQEVTESFPCSPYQSILLSEVADAHEAMQDDLHSLRQLAYKNSILLRQNTIKYYSTLEALEKYAGKVELLLGSGERVFASLKDKSAALRASFDVVFGEARRLRSFCDGITNDSKINWQKKATQLEQLSEEIAVKIGQLHEILAWPASKRASLATITCLHQSIQERLQVLLIYLSTLFVSSTQECESGTLERMRSLCLSSETLVDEMSALFITSSQETAKKKRHEKLLEISKARGARLLIPSELEKPTELVKAAPLTRDFVDDKLIAEFISAVKLNDSVPEFCEQAVASKSETVALSKPTVKVVEEVKPVDRRAESLKPVDKSEPAKPFSFAKPVEQFSFTKPAAEPIKAAFSFTNPVELVKSEESKPSFLFTKSPEPTKDSFTKNTESSKESSASASDSTSSFSFTSPKTTETKQEQKLTELLHSSSETSSSVLSVSTAKESSATASDVFSFKFDFAPSSPSPAVKAETASEALKKPIPGILSVSPAEPEKVPIPALLTAQNAFAPPSLTSPEKPAFSLNSTPSFGQTSFAQPASFGFASASAPAFGQTSMPAAASFLPPVTSTAPKPGAFAAFAQTGAQSLGFSSFTAPAGGTSAANNGLSFANFASPSAPAASEEDKDKPKPSFSFSGFRG